MIRVGSEGWEASPEKGRTGRLGRSREGTKRGLGLKGSKRGCPSAPSSISCVVSRDGFGIDHPRNEREKIWEGRHYWGGDRVKLGEELQPDHLRGEKTYEGWKKLEANCGRN